MNKNEIKQTLDIKIRPKLKIGEVERLIRKHRMIIPPPARSTLIGMCEDGTFETVKRSPTRLGWLIYEDSFWKWVAEMDGDAS